MTDLKPNRNWPDVPTIGDWDRETIRIDFDNIPLDRVIVLCRVAINQFKLQGLIVFESSKNSYHAVFNRKASSWEENLVVMSSLAIISQNVNVMKYTLMQVRKGSSTLRLGPKRFKRSPRVVYREGRQEGQIRKFLLNRQFIKESMRKTLSEDARE